MITRAMALTVWACAVLMNTSHSAYSADVAVTPIGKYAVPKLFDGKIMAVNPKERTVIVDLNGKLVTIHVTSQLILVSNGKSIKFEDLAAGQTVCVSVMEMPDGYLGFVALAVASNPEPLEAAGPTARRATLPPQAPFSFPPNPANVTGPPVSRHR